MLVAKNQLPRLNSVGTWRRIKRTSNRSPLTTQLKRSDSKPRLNRAHQMGGLHRRLLISSGIPGNHILRFDASTSVSGSWSSTIATNQRTSLSATEVACAPVEAPSQNTPRMCPGANQFVATWMGKRFSCGGPAPGVWDGPRHLYELQTTRILLARARRLQHR